MLGYPWLNAMTKDQEAPGYCSVLKIDPAKCATFEQYAPERLVAKDTPAAFIYHTTEDELVPVDASVAAIFWPMMPALPMPVTIALPLHVWSRRMVWQRGARRGRDCWKGGCAAAACCRRLRPRRSARAEGRPVCRRERR